MLSGLECSSLEVSRDSGKWDWEFARVSELFYVKGRIGWRGLRRSDFTVDGPFLITGMHIEGGRVQWEQCFHIPETLLVKSPQ